MEQTEFLFFEWFVIDKCNLPCEYCINSAGYNAQRDRRTYVSGYEIKIAEKIVDFSKHAKKVWVNLSGGEPLVAEHIIDAITLLKNAENIKIQLITNLKLLEPMVKKYPFLLSTLKIAGSIHISYRSDKELDNLINFLNRNSSEMDISLSQVDYNLSPQDHAKLTRIKEETGLDITFQTFVPENIRGVVKKREKNSPPPISELEETAENFMITRGKRCCVGFSHFCILPDATIWYDLWCHKHLRKTMNFLDIDSSKISDFLLDDMKKCQKKNCNCNYNMFHYEEYITAARRLGYSDDEIFINPEYIEPKNIEPENSEPEQIEPEQIEQKNQINEEIQVSLRLHQKIRRKLSSLKHHLSEKVKNIHFF